MSMQMARAVMDRMNLREALIAPHYSGFMADLRQFAEANHDEQREQAAQARVELLGAYGYEPGEIDKPFAFANGVAIIPISGLLINRFGSSWGFVTGYNFVRTQINQAKADPDVELIVLDVNSCGGEAAGCFELADDIYAAREDKPILAVVDSNCYSAAYALGSAASKVVLTPSGGVGSIGVVAMHISVEKMLDKAGYDITFVYAGKHKVDGNPYQKLPADVKASIQDGVDKSYEKFVATVARNRGLDAQAVRDTEAQIFRADDALALGLIDAIQPPSQAVAAFISELSGSDQPEEPDPMSDNATKPGESAAAAAPANIDAAVQQARSAGMTEGANAERERTKAILSCEQASGKTKLAHELAFNTNLTVEQAQGILAAAAPEKTEAAAPAPAPAAAAPSAFERAMDGSRNPQVGADDTASAPDPNSPHSAAQRILAAQSLATGKKYNTATH